MGKISAGRHRSATTWLVMGMGLLWGLSPAALAGGVHEGGVGACSFCHVMHGGGATSLLVDDTPADVCLSCHADVLGAVLSRDPLIPSPERGPGNFVFLLEDNLNDGPDGLIHPIGGDQAGHNIQAPGYGLGTDGTSLYSPGGSYPSSALTCTSCHDPHGNGNYRFLYGVGPVPGGIIFSNPAPTAEGLDLAGAPESSNHHIAYRAGMSRWCGNCHSAYLNQHNQLGGFNHVTFSVLSRKVIQRYNSYNGTADPYGGLPSSSYLAAVPFEDASASVGGTAGPSAGSRIMCLTCHRAHASSGPRSGRWDFKVGALGQDGVISGSYPLPNPYQDPKQEPLCFKCHSSMSTMKGP